jgi:hypothetical protein
MFLSLMQLSFDKSPTPNLKLPPYFPLLTSPLLPPPYFPLTSPSLLPPYFPLPSRHSHLFLNFQDGNTKNLCKAASGQVADWWSRPGDYNSFSIFCQLLWMLSARRWEFDPFLGIPWGPGPTCQACECPVLRPSKQSLFGQQPVRLVPLRWPWLTV